MAGERVRDCETHRGKGKPETRRIVNRGRETQLWSPVILNTFFIPTHAWRLDR